jgi:acetoacetate decarboxylase
MFLNDEGPIAGGRELWGFPKKLAQPTLQTEIDTLVGTLDYGPLRVATGTMGYKHREADLAQIKASLEAPNFLLKIIRTSMARRASASLSNTTWKELS